MKSETVYSLQMTEREARKMLDLLDILREKEIAVMLKDGFSIFSASELAEVAKDAHDFLRENF